MSTIAQLTVDLKAEVSQFRREMANVRKDTSDVKASMSSMGETVKNTVLGYLTFRTAAAAVGALADATMEAEQSQARLTSILKATGNAAGLTAQQISQMAEDMEGSTLFDDDAITNASAVLATFKSVSGDTFRQTIALAGDLSATFGGDLQASTVMLGKALEDPIKGLTALGKMGVQFSAAQRESIRVMLEHGQVLRAQQAILKEVAGQVGGAAAGQNVGLTGALNAAKDAWGDLLKGWGRAGVESGIAVEAINRIKEAMEFWTPNTGRAKLIADLDAVEARMGPLLKTMAFAKGRDTPENNKARQERLDGLEAERKAAQDAIKAFDALAASQTRVAKAGVRPQIAVVDVEAERRLAKETAKFWIDQKRELGDWEVQWFNQRQDAAEDNAAALLDIERQLADEVSEWQIAAFHERQDEAERVQKAMIDSAAESAQAYQEAAEESEQAWARFGWSMRNLLEDSLSGQIKSLREFASDFLAILARMSAEAAAMNIIKSVGGAVFNSLAGGFMGGGSGPSSAFSAAPSIGVSQGVSINLHMSNYVQTLDERTGVGFLERQSPQIAAGIVQQLRRSGALDAALRGG